MTKTKRSYDKAFKLEAVRLSETSAKSVRQIETDLDITPGRLHKWRARYRQQGTRQFSGQRAAKRDGGGAEAAEAKE